MENYPLEVAESLLDAGVVRFSLDPPFRWTSGIISPIYCDLRGMNSKVDARRTIVEAIVTMYPSIANADVIAGTATAGISWGAWVADKLGKPFVYIRKKAKEYGAKKRIEGLIESGKKVAIVEDLISTGGSSIASADALREEADADVIGVYAINTYQLKVAEEQFAAANLDVFSVTNYGVLLDAAQQRGAITEEQAAMLADFRNDPKGWAERHNIS